MALKFNGTTSRATLAMPDVIGAKCFSISFWLNWDAYGSGDNLAMEFSPDTNTNQGFYINPNSSSGNVDISFGSGVASYVRRYNRSMAPASVWNHYLMVISYNDPSITLYCNGTVRSQVGNSGTLPSTATVFNSQTLYLMHRGSGPSLYAAGRIAEIAVWAGLANPTALLDDSALALYNGRSPFDVGGFAPLIGYWPLENAYEGYRNRVRHNYSVLSVTSTSPAPHDIPTNRSTSDKNSGSYAAAVIPDIALNIEAATVLVDIQVSAVEVAAIGDVATVLVDIQPTGVDGAQYVDVSTVLVDVQVHYCEWYIPQVASEWLFVEYAKWYAAANTKWEFRATNKWQWELESVTSVTEEICF
jgi:hypothetical protein